MIVSSLQFIFPLFLRMKLIFLVLLGCGCMYPQKVFKEKTIIISANQSVSVSELGLTIKNQGCGRQWVSTNGEPAYERAFCDITVKTKDSTYHFNPARNQFFIKNIQFDIEKMNPWGRVEDSIPPGGCRIKVSKLPDTSR
ncbi:MAG: hypothetical protein BWZ05_00200 [Bacteroidetes bacterium ADurb.BinA245]|jgi:hypothetical protein|nr:MAG: hypothetical protein BWZ05_00200 [Bacteroidetes bacterium ADurb.BinA245]